VFVGINDCFVAFIRGDWFISVEPIWLYEELDLEVALMKETSPLFPPPAPFPLALLEMFSGSGGEGVPCGSLLILRVFLLSSFDMLSRY